MSKALVHELTSVHELAPILEAVSSRIGIRSDALHLGSSRTLVAHLSERVRAGQIGRVLEQIETDSAFFNELVDELTIRETYFFRDPGQFNIIAKHILPEIESRRHSHVVRCWSAGCSTGEEAYSLAMLLFKLGFANRSKVVGTDISSAALTRAHAGRYGKWSLRGESAFSAEPHLSSQGEWRVVSDPIRHSVRFFRLNLAENSYPLASAGISDFDIILCRNVLIYFDNHTISEVARRLFDSLACGGWLLTAAADPILTDYAPFEVITSEAGLLYRRPLSQDEQVSKPAEIPEAPACTRSIILNPQVPAPDRADQLSLAKEAFKKGDYIAAAELARASKNEPDACILRVTALANLGSQEAAVVAEQALEHHPLCPELYYLLSHLRLIDGDQFEAISLLRKAIYLSPSLAMAHFVLGSLLKNGGDLVGARRHLRNAIALAEARPAHELLALGDGQSTGMLADAARKLLVNMSGDEIK
ncbi:MAG TPA: CheR family methyltransferase [Candidatus Binataceae bacterium]|nr:CheR family methyltransferase [Candidatus Binataceae bacterium]